MPAERVIHPDGTEEWLENGQLHREDGPAHIGAHGTKEWWRRGRLCRPDGPTIERGDGTREWWEDRTPEGLGPREHFENGDLRLHREDGPAIERPDGSEEWYRHGRRVRPRRPPGRLAELARSALAAASRVAGSSCR